jgi:hypothetical protein
VMALREVPHKDQYKRGKEDSPETIQNEFEQGIADAEKHAKGDREQIRNADDLAALRARQPELGNRPQGADAKMWARYAEYWSQRAAELRHYFEQKRQGKKAGPAPEPMVTWKAYKDLRSPFERGHEFQKKVGEDLGDAKVSEVLGDKNAGKATLEDRYVIQNEVGVASKERKEHFKENAGERETPQRPDHLAIDKAQLEAYWSGRRKDPPTGVAFSDKSYNFKSMKTVAEVNATVNDHVAEALDSYTGKVEIRSDKFAANGHTLRNVSVTVDTLVLVYDGALATKTNRADIEKAAASIRSRGKTIKVIFR